MEFSVAQTQKSNDKTAEDMRCLLQYSVHDKSNLKSDFIGLLQSKAHHGDEASDEAEICEVVGINGGSWVDLQTVVVLAGIFEQTVHGVENLVGKKEEPLPAERQDRNIITAEEHMMKYGSVSSQRTCLIIIYLKKCCA